MTRRSVGLRSERGPLLGGLMLSTGLVALDATVIATAVPSIVDDLGGFSQFPWLFSAFLLTQAVSTPVYGRLSDVFGRKPVMLAGMGLFLAGSVLCALAWSMPALIVFRALQGLGAGAVLPMSNTIAGDVYTLHERAKVQGYLAGVWGVSAVVGPTLGGLLTQYAGWPWIFWVNIPLGVLAMAVVARTFTESVDRTRGTIDYTGAALLTVGCSLLIVGLLEGGQSWAWSSPASVATLTGGAALLAVFVVVERRTAEPILPLWVLTRRVLVASSLTSVAVGAILMGLTSYVPTFAQGVLGAGPLSAGFALATLTLGWPLAAAVSGRFYLPLGFRLTAVSGSALVVLGAVVVVVVARAESLVLLAAACFLVGVGLGLVASPTLIAAQASVGWAERGVVTAANLFARSLGSAVAVAAFGATANGVLDGAEPRGSALADASVAVFLGVAVAAVAMLVAVAFMPGRTAQAHAGLGSAAEARPAGP